MRYTVTLFAALALGGLFWTPSASAQKKNPEFVEIQREFYDLSKALTEIKTGQDERVGQLETLIKQLMDANSKLTDQLQALQLKIDDNTKQQERRILTPLDDIRNGVKDVWDTTQGNTRAIDSFKSRLDNLERSLSEISGTLGLFRDDFNNRTAPPPAVAVPAIPGDPSAGQASGNADGVTLAFATAERDKLAGKLQQALEEFRAIADAYPSSPEAPMAMYKVGEIYASVPQPEDAIKAFDSVLERFGENPMRGPAQFAKAEQFEALGKRAEAAREYNNYVKQFPDAENVNAAKQRAAQLARSPAASKPKGSKGK